jgi:hypothetical protein
MNEVTNNSVTETVTASDTVSATVVRGPESWTFIYVLLGFALTIEGNFIQMIRPLEYPWNLVVFLAAMLVTVWLFIFSGRFQNWLIGMKIKYERKAR